MTKQIRDNVVVEIGRLEKRVARLQKDIATVEDCGEAKKG